MSMPIGETVRAKAEEVRTKIRTRIEEFRGGAASSEHSPLIGKLGVAKGPLATEVREKGLIATARERIEKFRAPPAAPAPPAPTPPPPSPEVYGKPRVRTYTAKIKTY